MKAKVCRSCSARRAFADASHSGAHATATENAKANSAKGSHPVTLQVQQAAGMLKETLNVRSAGKEVAGVQNISIEPEKKVLEDKIKNFEMTLKSLPDTLAYAPIRQSINAEIVDAKRQINAAKPLGLRLESCKQALNRASDRRKQAGECLQAALTAKESADKDVERLQGEVAAIEMEINTTQGASCLGVLQEGMTKVLMEMSSGGKVPSETVPQARSQMEKLFQDLTSLATTCQQQMEQQQAVQVQQQAAQLAIAQQWMQHQPMLVQVPGSPLGSPLPPVPLMIPSVAQQLQHGVVGARAALMGQFNAAASAEMTGQQVNISGGVAM